MWLFSHNVIKLESNRINAFRTRSRLDGLAHVTYNSCGVYTCRNLVTSSPYSSSLHIICALWHVNFILTPFAPWIWTDKKCRKAFFLYHRKFLWNYLWYKNAARACTRNVVNLSLTALNRYYPFSCFYAMHRSYCQQFLLNLLRSYDL